MFGVCVFVCCGTLKKRETPPRVHSKTSPCMPATRADVFQHVRVVPVHTGTFCTYTRVVLNGHTGTEGYRQFCLPKFAHVWSSRASEVHQRNCVRVEGVQGVLTLFCGGVAQTCHDDRVVELKEQLVVEEVD